MHTLYCLYCQQENKQAASHCQHCGARLIPKDAELAQELDKQKSASQAPNSVAVAQCLRQLPLGGMALFFVSQEKPLMVPELAKLVLGRKQETTSEPVLDLSDYGRLAHSISRRHALISQQEDGYVLSDLGSTNGTWLNQQLLQPGKIYPLQSLDQVRLGLFSFHVCFHTQQHNGRLMRLYMQGHNSLMPGQHLFSPPYLLQQLAPYFHALNELHHLLAEGQQTEDLRLYAITEEAEGVVVKMEMGATVQQLLNETIYPWRADNADYIGQSASQASSLLGSRLQEVARELLAIYLPDVAASDSAIKRMGQALQILVTSRLEPTIRAD